MTQMQASPCKVQALSGMADALQRRERTGRGNQLAEDDCSRNANALALQVELRDAVLTQRGKWDPAEIDH